MSNLFKRIVMCCCLLGWCLLANAELAKIPAAEPTAETVANNMTVSMRDSGYTMGDTLDMTATFTLPVGHEIDEESLPLVGRVNYWLDIQSLDFQSKDMQQEQQVKLHIKWQLFATVEMAQQIKTPEIVLKTTGEKPQKIIIPQQAFYYSPVLPMPPLKDIDRHPDLTPPDFDTAQPLKKLSLCLGLFVIAGLAWLWLKDLLPGLPRAAGPMTQLARQLKSKSTHFTTAQLRDIHTALNKSAGVSLYPNNLSQLSQNAPYFAGEQENVTQFFNQSWAQFYRNEETVTGSVETKGVETTAHLSWIKRVAMAERLFRRQPKLNSTVKSSAKKVGA